MDESTHETPAEQTPPVETINETPQQAPVETVTPSETPSSSVEAPQPQQPTFTNSEQPKPAEAFPVVKHRKGWKFWLPIVVGIVIIAAAAIIVIPMLMPHSTTPVAQTTNTASAPAVSPATPLSSGTDNQSLQNDLTNIQSTQDQETTDQNSTTSSLDDSSQQISVPTE